MMTTRHGLESIVEPFPAATVAIGMFDGLHVGHKTLIRAAVDDANRHCRKSAVLTFDRHPAEIVSPDKIPGYLATPEQRVHIIESLGVEELVIARFDERFRDLSPESFLRFVVKGVLGAEAVFVGFDFRFGYDQAGDATYLAESQERFDYRVIVLDPIMVDGEKASSSRIRALLRSGDLSGAARMLGHPYLIAGSVLEGEKLGRKLGFPTANIQLSRNLVLPKDGIYAVWVTRNGGRYKGACSIGFRPTVDGKERTVEVYLLDFDGDLYDETLILEFVTRLRDEIKFDSLEELARQIALDVKQVESALNFDALHAAPKQGRPRSPR